MMHIQAYGLGEGDLTYGKTIKNYITMPEGWWGHPEGYECWETGAPWAATYL